MTDSDREWESSNACGCCSRSSHSTDNCPFDADKYILDRYEVDCFDHVYINIAVVPVEPIEPAAFKHYCDLLNAMFGAVHGMSLMPSGSLDDGVSPLSSPPDGRREADRVLFFRFMPLAVPTLASRLRISSWSS
ncbi:hypothetical protein KIPB_011121, partial [Kipferlia bialata]|eukprot:g11121.t1